MWAREAFSGLQSKLVNLVFGQYARGNHLPATKPENIDGLTIEPQPARPFPAFFREFNGGTRIGDVGSATECGEPHQAEKVGKKRVWLDQQMKMRSSLQYRILINIIGQPFGLSLAEATF